MRYEPIDDRELHLTKESELKGNERRIQFASDHDDERFFDSKRQLLPLSTLSVTLFIEIDQDGALNPYPIDMA